MLRLRFLALSGRTHRGAACLLLAAALGGCGIPSAFYAFFIDPLIPPPTVEAEHLLTDKTVLIWVDDTLIVPAHHLLRRELTDQIGRHLQGHQAVGSLIPYARIVAFRQQHPQSTQLSIQQLGREFQADEVLYLLLDGFQLSHEAGEGYYAPQISGSAKVIDVATGRRCWPEDQAQRSFSFQGTFQQGRRDQLEDRLVRETCQQAAQAIGPYFYKHQKAR
ncbi:MAG: hypothetical protein JW810_09465 [Sedimentisphaerales bacterium]|nr:hypothetical protein [Sedimentisphaerales bacterium]